MHHRMKLRFEGTGHPLHTNRSHVLVGWGREYGPRETEATDLVQSSHVLCMCVCEDCFPGGGATFETNLIWLLQGRG